MKTFSKVIFSFLLMALAALSVSLFLGPDAFAPAFIILFGIGVVKGAFGVGFELPSASLLDGFVISDTTYAGEVASQFIVKAITGADTVAGGHVYVKDGIKKKYTIPRFDANYEDFIQDRMAMPQAKGDIAITGVALNPQDYMIFAVFNPRDFEDHWFATQLNPTLIDRALPYTVESVVVQEVLKRHAKFFNKLIWNADKTRSDIYKYFDGFLLNAKNGAQTNIVGSPTTLTQSNIQAEMLKAYNAMPEAIRYDPNTKYFFSYASWDMYEQSQINQQYKGVDITTTGKDSFKGRKVVKIADFPDNTMLLAKGLATPESNLWVGLNSVDDEGLILQKLRPEGELWFIKMNMKADVQIGWHSETVYYGS